MPTTILQDPRLNIFPSPVTNMPKKSYPLEIPPEMLANVTNEMISRVCFQTLQGGEWEGVVMKPDWPEHEMIFVEAG